MKTLFLIPLFILSACSIADIKSSFHDNKIQAKIYVTESKEALQNVTYVNDFAQPQQVKNQKTIYATTYINNCAVKKNQCNMMVKYRLKQPKGAFLYFENRFTLDNNKEEKLHVLEINTTTLPLGNYFLEASFMDLNKPYTFNLYQQFELIKF